MIKYDLSDLGFNYKGAASIKETSIKVGKWTLIDIPVDLDIEDVKKQFIRFMDKIVALEIPTSLKCNLRCKYCYIEDPRLKNKDVSKIEIQNILDKTKEIIPNFSVDSNKKVFFSPWGAEPTLNIDTLNTLYEFCHENYGKDKYKISTSTNGTLWNKQLESFLINILKDNALPDIQISLDGPPEVQDKYRTYINGNPTFKDVEKFTLNLISLLKDQGVKDKKHHFCSTIHLQDPNFDKMWIAAAEFFSEPNKWWTSLPGLPMRMSGEDMYGEQEINRFINAQKLMLDLVRKRADQGVTVLDFYTMKLFGSIDCKSKNAFPYCSAMNTQIAIDLDGSIYPCHGPITTPVSKPFFWFGNLFEGVISYKSLIRNLNYQFNTWNKGKCTSCAIYHYTTGNICWSCGINNFSTTGEIATDNILKCIAYGESFKYWVEIAKMNINNPILDEIPKDLFCEPIKTSNKRIDSLRKDMHFDRNYDGKITESVRKLCNVDIDMKDTYFTDKWWKFDNFINCGSL